MQYLTILDRVLSAFDCIIKSKQSTAKQYALRDFMRYITLYNIVMSSEELSRIIYNLKQMLNSISPPNHAFYWSIVIVELIKLRWGVKWLLCNGNFQWNTNYSKWWTTVCRYCHSYHSLIFTCPFKAIIWYLTSKMTGNSSCIAVCVVLGFWWLSLCSFQIFV